MDIFFLIIMIIFSNCSNPNSQPVKCKNKKWPIDKKISNYYDYYYYCCKDKSKRKTLVKVKVKVDHGKWISMSIGVASSVVK